MATFGTNESQILISSKIYVEDKTGPQRGPHENEI